MGDNVVYTKIDSVYFDTNNNEQSFTYVEELEDKDDQIIIRSIVKIDFIDRGWIGDIVYRASKGLDVTDYKRSDLISAPHYIKDALCVRVNTTYYSKEPVEWEYVFLKY